MKKILITLIAGAMVLSMVACTKTNVEENNTPNDDVVVEQPDAENDENADVNSDVNTDANTDVNAEADGLTAGKQLAQVFKDNFNADATAEELANAIVEKGNLPFSAGAMKVEEGLLSGFDNYEVKGFEDGAVFMPMIGSIPFVGYIFKLADDADVDAFTTALEENSNRRWNICVEADETIIEVEGNTVFFLMSPTSFEEEPADDMAL